jgi:hypothetical protein
LKEGKILILFGIEEPNPETTESMNGILERGKGRIF